MMWKRKSVIPPLLLLLVVCSAVPVVFAFDPSYTVKTGVLRAFTSSNNKRSLARTNDGALHCVYTRWNGTLDLVYYAYSKDFGVTWIEEQVSKPPSIGNQSSPAIAVDSLNNVHVVWFGKGWGANPEINNVEYRMRPISGWQPQEAVTDKSTSQTGPSIAVDSMDNVHVVWGGGGWGNNPGDANIEYRMRSSSGWQAR